MPGPTGRGSQLGYSQLDDETRAMLDAHAAGIDRCTDAVLLPGR